MLSDRRHEICASVAIAAALARRHGRSAAFEAATTAALEDANQAITVHDSLWVDMTDEEIEYLLPEARHLMGIILTGLYGHMVVLEHLVGCEGIDAELSSHVHATVLSVVRHAAYPAGASWPSRGTANLAGAMRVDVALSPAEHRASPCRVPQRGVAFERRSTAEIGRQGAYEDACGRCCDDDAGVLRGHPGRCRRHGRSFHGNRRHRHRHQCDNRHTGLNRCCARRSDRPELACRGALGLPEPTEAVVRRTDRLDRQR
ncbi:MAG: hypothetical protein M5U19_21725 [Microthrixaceae bacterium]|nr:hypothetical protein [Microthrixaceae bacterium]